ncbi:MAG: hypothetical protein HZB57_02525 [Gammaproteobacteria bacterium]|nr:hypothetical protein [Gammaproteobacteria bacterium]
MVNLNLYALLGILEVILVIVVWASVASVKLRGASRDVASLRKQLSEAPIVSAPTVAAPVAAPAEPSAPPPEYADFLREQIERSNLLLGEDLPAQAQGALDAAQQEDSATLTRQMLAARHQFLQLELDTQDAAGSGDDDVQAQRQRIVAGMQALLDGLSWKPTPPTDMDAAADAESVAVPTGRSEVTKLQEQIGYLRSVIDNQHNVMRELRHLLEAHDGDSEDLQAALRKLGDAEAQAVELHRCLEVIEQENERLKGTGRGQQGIAASPDADMLRDLVGNQQRTIGKLQSMLRHIVPDGGKSSELEDAINKIQRSNNELNSCVMVLEDENTMLRNKVESLQERLADIEAGAADTESSVQVPEMVAQAGSDVMDVSGEAPGEVVAPAPKAELEPEPPQLVSADADFDVDALLESAAAPVVSEVAAADEDIDALLESFAQGAAPAPAPEASTQTPVPAEDDTDALLADLFGDTPPASR